MFYFHNLRNGFREENNIISQVHGQRIYYSTQGAIYFATDHDIMCYVNTELNVTCLGSNLISDEFNL